MDRGFDPSDPLLFLDYEKGTEKGTFPGQFHSPEGSGLRRILLVLLPVGGGGDPQLFLKTVAEIVLVGIAAFVADFFQRQIGLF